MPNFFCCGIIFALFCWIPVGVLSCIIPLAIAHTSLNGISSTVILKCGHIMNVNFPQGCVYEQSGVSAPQGQGCCLVIFLLLPLSPPLCLISIVLAEHLVGSPYYYYNLLKEFWTHWRQIREHGLLSPLCELIVLLVMRISGISLQKKQV